MVLALDLLCLKMKGRRIFLVFEALLVFKNGILLELRLMESLVTTVELGMLV